MIATVRVLLWGSDIGAVTWLPDRGVSVFQYTPDFARSRIEVSPIMMPLREDPYEFPALSFESFRGLPGLLADSLPDRFGNALIDAWLSQEGRSPDSFTPVERLCYTGVRGMGALEFKPKLGEVVSTSRGLDIDALVSLANRVLDDRVALSGKLGADEDARIIEDILRVGTSAGGARAKAVIAWNPRTGDFRSGQVPASNGFEHWLMKFDGIHGNKDKELADPQGFGRIEYAYYLMAREAGIVMNDCRLHEENGRAHFMTKRFDRRNDGDKLHMQSLSALLHYDFNLAGAYSYEQALLAIRRLGLPRDDMAQQIRRAYFNILARNQDDHVKNIAFLMNRRGEWRLSPAFDLAYSFNPTGAWTGQHQMSLAGRRDAFNIDDLVGFAATGDFKKVEAKRLLNEVAEAVSRWGSFAEEAGVAKDDADRVAATHRLNLMTGS